MFDKKSEYALNKHDQDSIIYISVSGHIRLTRADFSSEEEFLKWKAWSDEDYHEREKSGRSFNDNRVALNECLDVVGQSSPQKMNFSRSFIEADVQAVKKALTERRLAALRSILNAKQYRRIWMYCAEGKVRYGDCKARRSNESQRFPLTCQGNQKNFKKVRGGPQK